MSRSVVIFLAGTAGLAVLAGLLAWLLTLGVGPGALPAALASILSGAITVLLGFFQLRRSLNYGNLRFLKAYFGGMALRFALLVAAGLIVRFSTDWDIVVFMMGLAVTYPVFLAFEAWRINGDLPGRRGTGERPS